MRLRWTVILILINGVLLWMVGQQLAKPASQHAFEGNMHSFLPLQKAEWDSVGLLRTEGGWRATRDKWGRWWLKTPLEWPAKSDKLARMMGFLGTLPVDSAFATADLKRVGQNLRSYGLDNPKAVLEVTSGSKTLSYKIGSATPLGNKLYVLSPDENEIWVVDGGLNDFLRLSVDEVRNEGFFPFSMVELEGVDVQMDAFEARLERKSGGSDWQLKLKNSAMPLEMGAWEGWLANLGQQTVGSFTVLDADAQGLKNPAGRLTFQTLYGRRTLLIGGVASKTARWAQWEGSKSVFTVPQESVAALKPEYFLPSHLFALPADSVTGVDCTLDGKHTQLRRLESGKWVVATLNNAPADARVVEAFIAQLKNLSATPVLGSETAAAAANQISLQTGNTSVTLSFSADYQKAYRSDLPLVYSFATPVALGQERDFVDKHFFEATNVPPTKIVWKSAQTGKNTEVALSTPAAQALVALLSNPVVEQWLPVQDNTVAADYELIVTWADRSWRFTLWAKDGWVVGLEGRFFKPTAPWQTLFEGLKTLPL